MIYQLYNASVSYNISISSTMIQEQNKVIQITPSQKSQLFLMSEFYKLINSMEMVEKTIIIYDVYEEDKKFLLASLQSVSAGILSQQIQVNGIYKEDPDDSTQITVYSECDIKQAIRKKLIDVTYFKVRQDSNQQELSNIRLYHSIIKGEKVRVITLPIEQKLTNKTQIENINEMIKKIQNQNYKIRKNLKGAQLKDFTEKSQKQLEELKNKYCESMRLKHMQMFRIEALLYVIRLKTKLISVCGAIDAKKQSKNDEVLLENLFDVPEKGRQFIIHTANNAKKIPYFEAKQKVSCVWRYEKERQCTWTKNQCFDQKYFTSETKDIKTKIYKLMSQVNNEFLAKVIEDFIKTWTNITFSSATCITPVVQAAYKALNFGQDLSKSFIDLNTSLSGGSNQQINVSKALGSKTDIKQTFVVYSFNEVFKKYSIPKDLPVKMKIEQFYTRQRLNGIQIEKGEKKIPEVIQLLTFIHYFYQINKQFCESYTTEERKDQQTFIKYVSNYLKTVYDLVNEVNKNRWLQQESVCCKNMQDYFNFLYFLFESSKLIKSITNRQLAICDSLKAFFDNLIPKQNKLLTYILQNEENIKEGQPVHYYDLYLKIIKENSKGLQSKIQYIYLKIHRFKADQISGQYIYSKKRVVEAIKSYSQIIHQYDRLAETKRDRINKYQIQKKIARLLFVLGLTDQAARIYMKNHLVKSAQRCFKQILNEYTGDARANKYIEFGKYFQSEFSFAKAIDYYQSAYEAAKTTAKMQEAIKRKMECVLHSQNIREDQKRQFVRFYTGQGTQAEFLSGAMIQQDEKVQQSQFSRLRNKLMWDEVRGTSVINEEDNQSEAQML